MRQSREAKAETHAAIVKAAARLFRERGVEQTSVADVMQAADLTHGGFYRHFASKEALVAAAATAGSDDILSEFERRKAIAGGEASLAAYFGFYLSRNHVEQPESGCPLAAFGVDAGRMGGAPAEAFAQAADRLIAAIAARLPGPKGAARARAARTMAELVGAVVIARATGGGAVGQEILAACRRELGLR